MHGMAGTNGKMCGGKHKLTGVLGPLQGDLKGREGEGPVAEDG